MTISSDTGLTAIALANTLDDDAVSTLTGFVSGDISRILNTGAEPSDEIRRISPLATIPMEEINLYAAVLEIPGDEDMSDEVGLQSDIRSILSKYSRRHPSSLYAVSHIGEAIRKSGEKNQRITTP
jgi:tRNA(Ile)-lysidine synthase TilS/MesJ